MAKSKDFALELKNCILGFAVPLLVFVESIDHKFRNFVNVKFVVKNCFDHD